MRIKNAKVFDLSAGFKTADIVTSGEYIDSTAASDGQILDAYDFYAIPALIDARVTETATTPFDEGGNYAIDKIGKELAAKGVGAWLGSVRMPKEHVAKVANFVNSWNATKAADHADAARIAGLSLERPIEHIAEAAPSSASWEDLARDDADAFIALNKDAQNLINLVDLDPAVEGSAEYIKLIKDHTHVAILDRDNSFVDAEAAIKAGATIVTRGWGKESKLDQAKPGVVDAAFKNEKVTLELVASGEHTDAENVRATYALFGERVMLTTHDGDLLSAVKRIVEFGVPMVDAIRSVTERPAVALGLERQMGTLEDGKLANIVLIDHNFEVKHVINRGVLVF